MVVPEVNIDTHNTRSTGPLPYWPPIYWPPVHAEFQVVQLLLFCNQTFVFLESLYAPLNPFDGYIGELSRKS